MCQQHFEKKYILRVIFSIAAIPTLNLPEGIDVGGYRFTRSYNADGAERQIKGVPSIDAGMGESGLTGSKILEENCLPKQPMVEASQIVDRTLQRVKRQINRILSGKETLENDAKDILMLLASKKSRNRSHRRTAKTGPA